MWDLNIYLISFLQWLSYLIKASLRLVGKAFNVFLYTENNVKGNK